MDEKLLGKCGFYCGACPDFLKGSCKSCVLAHQKGDCFSRDCVIEKGLRFCGDCEDFPCETILEKPKCTVLDKNRLLWKKSERK